MIAKRLWACALLALAPTSVPFAQTPEPAPHDATKVVPGVVVRREAGVGETFEFRIAAARGEVIYARVEQLDLDVAVTLLDPAGTPLFTVDRPTGAWRAESVVAVAAEGGDFTIRILTAHCRAKARGAFELLVEPPHAATAKDAAAADASRLLARLYDEEAGGRLDAAVATARDALSRLEVAYGEGSKEWIIGLASLVRIVTKAQTDPGQEVLFDRLVASLDRSPWPGAESDLEYAEALDDAGGLAVAAARYGEAEALCLHALRILDGRFSDPFSDKLTTLMNLASIARNSNMAERSEQYSRRALANSSYCDDPDDPNRARILSGLGEALRLTEKYDEARRVLETAAQTFDRIGDPALAAEEAVCLNNLGLVLAFSGDLKAAEATLEKAATQSRSAFGPDSAATANTENSLGWILVEAKSYAEAKRVLLDALRIQRKVLGETHPFTAISMEGLAWSALGEGAIGDAVRWRSEANHIRDRYEAWELLFGDETADLERIRSERGACSRSISLHLRFAPDSPEAATCALFASLMLKGRLLEASIDRKELVHQLLAVDPDASAADTSRVRELLRDAETAATAPSSISAAGRASLRSRLTELAERGVLTRLASMLRPTSIERVVERIPAGTALVDYVAYVPHDLSLLGDGEPSRYAAYVVRSDGRIRAVDLGLRSEIDRAVQSYLDAVSVESKIDRADEPSKALRRLLVDPIVPLLGNATGLEIIPDGGINFVPFDALLSDEGNALCERYSVRYLATARALDRSDDDVPAREPALVLADAEAARWSPLPAARAEAGALARLFRGARLRTGALATRSALVSARGPVLLHIATHAAAAPATSGAAQDGAAVERASKVGIWLSSPGGAGDFLTDADLAGLDLRGCALAVLAGCSTGLGPTQRGEGVFGARRALELAGARSQIVTLWDVRDNVSKVFFETFYTSLAHGETRGRAFAEARDAVRGTPGWNEPYYWAAFTLSGDVGRLPRPAASNVR